MDFTMFISITNGQRYQRLEPVRLKQDNIQHVAPFKQLSRRIACIFVEEIFANDKNHRRSGNLSSTLQSILLWAISLWNIKEVENLIQVRSFWTFLTQNFSIPLANSVTYFTFLTCTKTFCSSARRSARGSSFCAPPTTSGTCGRSKKRYRHLTSVEGTDIVVMQSTVFWRNKNKNNRKNTEFSMLLYSKSHIPVTQLTQMLVFLTPLVRCPQGSTDSPSILECLPKH